jgi:hypothetical protein
MRFSTTVGNTGNGRDTVADPDSVLRTEAAVEWAGGINVTRKN